MSYDIQKNPIIEIPIDEYSEPLLNRSRFTLWLRDYLLSWASLIDSLVMVLTFSFYCPQLEQSLFTFFLDRAIVKGKRLLEDKP